MSMRRSILGIANRVLCHGSADRAVRADTDSSAPPVASVGSAAPAEEQGENGMSRREVFTEATPADGAILAAALEHIPGADRDPIFALIEAVRRADGALLEATRRTDAAQDAFRESGFDRRPRVQTGTLTTIVDDRLNPLPQAEWKSEPVYAYSRADIEATYGRAVADPLVIDTGERRVTTSTERAGALEGSLARFEADERAIAEARQRFDVDRREREQDEAMEALSEAEHAVFAANPTTPGGLVALIDLFAEREMENVGAPVDELLTMLFSSVKAHVPRSSARTTDADADLAKLTFCQLLTLYDAHEAAAAAFIAIGNQPRSKGIFGLLETKADSCTAEMQRIAEHVLEREPGSQWDRETKGELLVRWNIACGGWTDLVAAVRENFSPRYGALPA